MSRELEAVATHALEAARRAGAVQVAVRAGRTRYTSLSVRERRLEKTEAATSSGLSISLYLDGRYSSSATSDLRPAAVEAFCHELVDMTRRLAPDPHRALPDAEHYAGRVDRDLGLYHPGHLELDVDQRLDLARAAEEAALAASDQVVSVTASVSDSVSESVRLHSNGFFGTHRSSYHAAHVESSVRGQGDKKPMDRSYVAGRRFDQLGDPEQLGRRATERALRAVGAAKIESARLPMVVENRAAARLVRALLSPMSAASLQQQRSCLEGKRGEQIASAQLTLVDDPFLIGGFGSRLYDGEGITARRRVMIEQGRLRCYYVDVYYGRKLGWRATSGSRSNLVFEGGAGALEELLAGIERGVLITSFLGGNSNTTTGDFSLGVRGRLIEDGALTRPVAEMNITDNLLRFWPRLSAVGTDPYLYSAVRVPSLRFEAVPFSGS